MILIFIIQLCIILYVLRPYKKKTLISYISVKSLVEDDYYTFKVLATSINDEITVSNHFTLEVPAYRKNRAISMSIIIGLGFLAIAVGAIWWAKKRFCQNLPGEK